MEPYAAFLALVPAVDLFTVTVGGALAFVVLMGVSAFFSSSEIAMFSLARHRIDALAAEGSPGARRVQRLRENPHRMLVTILVGNNLANIAMSAIATALLGFYLSPTQAVLVATVGVTSLVLLFSESAPKSYAVVHAEDWALTVAGPLELTQKALYPIVWVFDHLTQAINALTGGQTALESAYITRSELEELIEAGEKEGVLETTEGDILQRTLQFTSTIAREVMVPRVDVSAVPASAGLEEALEACVDSGHNRLPVYEGDLDDVVGTVHVLDLVRARRAGADQDVRDLVRDTIVVPDTKPVDDLLTQLQASRLDVAVVMDEFGAVGGIVTVEDIVEELVGAILRPTEEPPIEMLEPTKALVLGDVTIEAVNEALGTDLPTDAPYETLAGLLLERAGRLVDEDETVRAHGLKLTPVEVENGRIVKIRVALAGDGTTPDSGGDPDL